MALKRTSAEATSPAAERAEEVFNNLDKFANLAERRKRGQIKRTVTISFRVLDSERERIEQIMEENGYTLASGSKKAVYEFIKQLTR